MKSDTTVVTSELLNAFKSAKSAEDKMSDHMYIQVVVDMSASRQLVDSVKQFLIPNSPNVNIEVDKLVEVNPTRPISARDFSIIIAGDNTEDVAAVANNFSSSHIPCAIIVDNMVIAPDDSQIKSLEAAPISLILACDQQQLKDKLSNWMVDVATEQQVALATLFPEVKDTVIAQMIKGCATENAAIALIPFLGSADMPAMVANQVKMAIGIAAVNGKQISWAMTPEILSVIGAGYLFRQIVRLVPVNSSVIKNGVKVGVGFGGTYLIGKSLQSYYGVAKNFKTYLPF